jgi:hypothetical protein
MSKNSLKPSPTQNAQRERPLDANTQLWLLILKKLPALDSAFVEEGSDLIPTTIMEHFSLLLILSRIGLAAQNAQRVHGVPASLLIGKYLTDYGWDPEHSGEKAGRLFLKEADTLRRNLPGDLNLLSSPVEYAIALRKLGALVNSCTGEPYEMYCLDVVSQILDHGLLACDYRYGTGGLYDLGEYVRPEGVATVLGCSVELASLLYETGELTGFSEKPSSTWSVSGYLLRAYVQRAQARKFRHPAALELHLVPKPAEPEAATVADC